MPSPTGITIRHSRSCRSHGGGGCNCDPSYVAWIYDARTKGKRYKTFSGKGAKSAAKNWRSDAGSALRKGTLPEQSRTTLEQECQEWLKRLDSGDVRAKGGKAYKPSVERQYRADIANYIVPKLGNIRLAQLRIADVQTLLVDVMLERGLSGSRVHGCLNALRAVLRRPLAHGGLLQDPTRLLEVPADIGKRDRAATPDEATRLLDSLPDQLRALYGVAMYAGLRRGELRALRVSDLDDGLTEISVRRSWDDKAGEIAPKSTASTRTVFVCSPLRRLLLEHIALSGRRGDDLLFGRTRSDPFTPTHVPKKALGAWAASTVGGFLRGESSNLEPIGLHECRHTFSTWLDAANITDARSDRYMGHSDGRVQTRYRHQLPGQSIEDAKVFDEYLTGTQTGTQPLRMVAEARG